MRLRFKAVFIDRDGVLIRDADYLGSIDRISIFKSASMALRLLRKSGYKIIIVTNQSGIAKGYFTAATVRRIHIEIHRRLRRTGARWDAIYTSPHGPESRHPWRKPGTGMIMAAKRRFNLDLRSSYLIGDKTSDIECARRAGCSGILVRTGKRGRDREFKAKPKVVCRDLFAAARWIISDQRKSR